MKPKIIFFGNGPLADSALKILEKETEIVFHAREKSDLEVVKKLKSENPSLKGILASFGVIIKKDVLDLFEPEGILNIHPSLLPDLRGPSPIETAILRGDSNFSVSIMKLVKEMDAGPIFYQNTLENLPLKKFEIYDALATDGATWLIKNLDNLPTPTPQNSENATFSKKFTTADSPLNESEKTAEELLREIIAFEKFPKSKHSFFGRECTILSAKIVSQPDQSNPLVLNCAKNSFLKITRLQPESRKPMDQKSFLNGYKK